MAQGRLTHPLPHFAAMMTGTQVAEINLQPSQSKDYNAYVPVRLGSLTIAAFIDSGNIFANVILPQTMVALGILPSQLEPVPQLSVGTAAAGKRMKVLGQAPRIDLQLGEHLAKFRIRPLVLQGLVHPVNICGPFLARAGIDQIHSKGVLKVHGKEVPMCPPRQPDRTSRLPQPQPSPGICTLHVSAAPARRHQYTPRGQLSEARLGKETFKVTGRTQTILPLQLHPQLPASTLVLLEPTVRSLLGDNPILQEVQTEREFVGSRRQCGNWWNKSCLPKRSSGQFRRSQPLLPTSTRTRHHPQPPRRKRSLTLFPKATRSSGW